MVARKDDNRKRCLERKAGKGKSCASGFLVSARPIGWASLDEEAREGINGKVDKIELAGDVRGRL